MVAKFKSTTHLQIRCLFFWAVSSEFDFKVCKKGEKRLMRKKLWAEKWLINLVFDFFTVCKIFRPLTSFGWTLKLNADVTAEKTKNVCYKCVLEFHFTSISGLGGSIRSKMAKSLYPGVHALFYEFTKARNFHWRARILMELLKRARSLDSLVLSLE
jgi:hypothetical protein